MHRVGARPRRFPRCAMSEPAPLAHDAKTALRQHTNQRGVVARGASVKQPAVRRLSCPALRVGSIGSHLLTVTANGLRFHVEHAGEGPAVLLLHGFPDTGDVWRHQVPALAAAGLRTIVPDLRGRGRSERPQETSAYALPELVADATGILDAFGIERAHILGHDWGAALAWAVAALAPERVDRLVVMSVGFPGAIRPDRRTLEQGWYRLLVLFPQAEELLLRDDAYLLRTLIAGAPDADRYLALLDDPEALTAGLAWYRANSPVSRTSPAPTSAAAAGRRPNAWPLRRKRPIPNRTRDPRLREVRNRRLALPPPQPRGPLAPARTARPDQRPPARLPRLTVSLRGHSQTLAHHGVLLLDELPEFPRSVLEALRQPLEDGVVSVARVGGRELFPARFRLVATIKL